MKSNLNFIEILFFFLCRFPFNILLLHLGAVCCIECLLNMTVSSIYLITHPKFSQDNGLSLGWRFGWFACQLNSYFMELIPFIYTIILLTLLIDRAFALKDPIQYKKNISVAKQRCYLLLYWLLSIVSILPIGMGLVESWPFPNRYSCQVRNCMLRNFCKKYSSLISDSKYIICYHHYFRFYIKSFRCIMDLLLQYFTYLHWSEC